MFQLPPQGSTLIRRIYQITMDVDLRATDNRSLALAESLLGHKA